MSENTLILLSFSKLVWVNKETKKKLNKAETDEADRETIGLIKLLKQK
jgi:hypothetical protein